MALGQLTYGTSASAHEVAVIAVMKKELLTDADRAWLRTRRASEFNAHINARIDELLAEE